MDVIESPKPVVLLSYRDCEICCCHLDGYRANIRALLKRLSEIEAVFLRRPAHVKFKVWYNLDENDLDERTMKSIVESIFRFEDRIDKIAFIGLRGFARCKFDRILERSLARKSFPRAYFQDAERAKGWLV